MWGPAQAISTKASKFIPTCESRNWEAVRSSCRVESPPPASAPPDSAGSAGTEDVRPNGGAPCDTTGNWMLVACKGHKGPGAVEQPTAGSCGAKDGRPSGGIPCTRCEQSRYRYVASHAPEGQYSKSNITACKVWDVAWVCG